MRLVVNAAAVVLCAVSLVSCGGGGDASPQPALFAQELPATDPALCASATSESDPVRYQWHDGVCRKTFDLSRVQPEAPAAATPRVAAQLQPFTFAGFLSWAETTYPQLFSGTRFTGTYNGYTYTFYSGTGHYLAMRSDNTVYALGPATGSTILYVGSLNALACFVYPANCTTTPSLATHTTGTGLGTITPGPGTFTKGQTVTVTAAPDFFSDFRGWTGLSTHCVGTLGGCRIVMDQDEYMEARFESTTFRTSFDTQYLATRPLSTGGSCTWSITWSNTKIEIKYSLQNGVYKGTLHATGDFDASPASSSGGASCTHNVQSLDKYVDAPGPDAFAIQFVTFGGSSGAEYVTLQAIGSLPASIGAFAGPVQNSAPVQITVEYTGGNGNTGKSQMLGSISRYAAP